jgi:hypothetical protein
MARIEKTVFISYRRKDISWALAVYQYLTSQKYDVFFDYTSIPSGDFEQIIVSNIKARAHFVLILTPTALDRCSQPGDWLRREIETAIDEKRNIIPLFFDGFNFGSSAVSEKLTGKLATLPRYNGLDIPSGYFMEGMQRLCGRYLNVPLNAVLHPVPTEVRKVVIEEQVAANKALVQKSADIKKLVKSVDEEKKRNSNDVSEITGSEVNTREKKESIAKKFKPKKLIIPNLKLWPIGLGALVIFGLVIWGGKAIFTPTEATQTPSSASTPVLLTTDTPASMSATRVPGTNTPILATKTATMNPVVGGGTGKIFFCDMAGNLFSINSNGTDPTLISDNFTVGDSSDGYRSPDMCQNLSFSSDGKKIIFGHSFLTILDLDGMIFNSSYDVAYSHYTPDWSHDGKYFVTSSGATSAPNIWLINTQTFGLRRLTDENESQTCPRWSPDDQRIAFIGGKSIWTISSAGFEKTEIVSYDGTDTYASWSCPSWSHDGAWLAYSDGNRIVLVKSDGSEEKRIIIEQDTAANPNFSPDGKYIAYSAKDGIYVVNINTLQVNRIAQLEFSSAWYGKPVWQPEE